MIFKVSLLLGCLLFSTQGFSDACVARSILIKNKKIAGVAISEGVCQVTLDGALVMSYPDGPGNDCSCDNLSVKAMLADFAVKKAKEPGKSPPPYILKIQDMATTPFGLPLPQNIVKAFEAQQERIKESDKESTGFPNFDPETISPSNSDFDNKNKTCTFKDNSSKSLINIAGESMLDCKEKLSAQLKKDCTGMVVVGTLSPSKDVLCAFKEVDTQEMKQFLTKNEKDCKTFCRNVFNKVILKDVSELEEQIGSHQKEGTCESSRLSEIVVSEVINENGKSITKSVTKSLCKFDNDGKISIMVFEKGCDNICSKPTRINDSSRDKTAKDNTPSSGAQSKKPKNSSSRKK